MLFIMWRVARLFFLLSAVYITSVNGQGDVIQPPQVNKCRLPKVPGNGPLNLQRYWYNWRTCKCEKFTYRGFGGNANRFNSIQICQFQCRMTHCEVCNLPNEIIFCTDQKSRWWYNFRTGRCVNFNGCEGDGNNFANQNECAAACHDNKWPTCQLPKKVGPCLAIIPRWFYNMKTCKCEEFNYGGCQPNENNFRSKKDCEFACKDFDCKICNLPAKRGPCLAIIPRYFFNIHTCKCEKFNYGGCEKNFNNWIEKKNCEDVCGAFQCPVCTSPRIIGIGGVPEERWYLEKSTCTCKKFTWGGALGNLNNFRSEQECKDRCKDSDCACGLPTAVVGPCEAAIPRWTFNTQTCTCERFLYGGCQGNANNFVTKSDCNNLCKNFECAKPDCLLPAKKGPCNEKLKRFFYNHKKCQCQKFTYGGCQGNSNNFIKKKDCNKACKDIKCPICSFPADSGPCLTLFPKWYFNVVECTCKEFIYGGCLGNNNRFDTKAQCEEACGGHECPVCNLPSKKGPCKKNINRFYHDVKTCTCKSFKYGGCLGNLNNFVTKDDCEKSCSNFTCPVCELPKDTGSCSESITKWWYNKNTNKCKKFQWSGCGGNGNNFSSKNQCNKICKN